ncbi:hypothetical protein [Ruminococcus flavefaciens]|jgi:hypothetical protein|uniref:hypothetical protein n=1 Tax=Ruminococcus flavefaciens TaxID=1265 RepID=UPI00046419BF|nr:hypothetical protein [Ruminococcus flavefaciens]
MFYVKERLEGLSVEVELTDKNVFTNCFYCGKEMKFDLSRAFSNGNGDLFGSYYICDTCAYRENILNGSLEE